MREKPQLKKNVSVLIPQPLKSVMIQPQSILVDTHIAKDHDGKVQKGELHLYFNFVSNFLFDHSSKKFLHPLPQSIRISAFTFKRKFRKYLGQWFLYIKDVQVDSTFYVTKKSIYLEKTLWHI